MVNGQRTHPVMPDRQADSTADMITEIRKVQVPIKLGRRAKYRESG